MVRCKFLALYFLVLYVNVHATVNLHDCMDECAFYPVKECNLKSTIGGYCRIETPNSAYIYPYGTAISGGSTLYYDGCGPASTRTETTSLTISCGQTAIEGLTCQGSCLDLRTHLCNGSFMFAPYCSVIPSEWRFYNYHPIYKRGESTTHFWARCQSTVSSVTTNTWDAMCGFRYGNKPCNSSCDYYPNVIQCDQRTTKMALCRVTDPSSNDKLFPMATFLNGSSAVYFDRCFSGTASKLTTLTLVCPSSSGICQGNCMELQHQTCNGQMNTGWYCSAPSTVSNNDLATLSFAGTGHSFATCATGSALQGILPTVTATNCPTPTPKMTIMTASSNTPMITNGGSNTGPTGRGASSTNYKNVEPPTAIIAGVSIAGVGVLAVGYYLRRRMITKRSTLSSNKNSIPQDNFTPVFQYQLQADDPAKELVSDNVDDPNRIKVDYEF